MNKIVQILSLCKRAGKLVMGFDVVKESLEKRTAQLLVISNGLSDKTVKEVNFLSNKYNIQLVTIDLTLDELWYVVGKRVGVFSVTDKALSQKLISTTN